MTRMPRNNTSLRKKHPCAIVPHIGQGNCHGLEQTEYRRPFHGIGCALHGIDEYAEIDYLIVAESRGMIHADGSFLSDCVW